MLINLLVQTYLSTCHGRWEGSCNLSVRIEQPQRKQKRGNNESGWYNFPEQMGNLLISLVVGQHIYGQHIYFIKKKYKNYRLKFLE